MDGQQLQEDIRVCGTLLSIQDELLEFIVQYGGDSVFSNLRIARQMGAGRSSEVERSLMVRWVVRRIYPSWGGPIELFLVPASAPRLV